MFGLKKQSGIEEVMFTRKSLIKLLIPLVIEQLLGVLVGMVDGVMVSAVSESAVSGVNLVDQINVLLINLFTALATGGSVVVAQFVGSGRKKSACEAANQLILVIGGLTVLIMAAANIFQRQAGIDRRGSAGRQPPYLKSDLRKRVGADHGKCSHLLLHYGIVVSVFGRV